VPSPGPLFHNHRVLDLESRSVAETRRLATALSPMLRPGDVLALGGDLGAGKTTFVQGLAVGLGIVERVTSPSFVLMREYLGGRYPLMHMDVYRLERMQEVVDLGYAESLDHSNIVVVEWGDMVDPRLPKEHLAIQMRYGKSEKIRHISVMAKGGQWETRMHSVRSLVEELFSVGRDDPPPPAPKAPPPEELL